MLRVARFLRGYLGHPLPGVREEEVSVEVRGESVAATLYSPVGAGRWGGWVALHGITVPGRHHPSLKRFAHSLAAAGGAVLVPDIPAWRELRIDPPAADATISAAARFLLDRPEVRPGGVGVVGFSFGATQALITAADPRQREAVRSVVSFGGYCDLERTLVCMITGVHEWEGVRRRLAPDPYGRWIVAANYLTSVPAYAAMQAVSEGARELAAEAGRRGKYAADRVYDPVKAVIRERLDSEERAVWDLIAPPSDRLPPEEPGRRLAEELVEAALRTHPALDPRPVLPSLAVPVVLAHGMEDRLIPYTETLRLRDALADGTPASATITRLFAHSTGAERLGALEYPLEAFRYLRLLHRALR